MKYLKKFYESLSADDIVFECNLILSDFIDEYDGDLKVKSFLIKDNRKNSEGNYNNPDIPGISIEFDNFSQNDMLNLLGHINHLNDFLEENGYFLEDIPGEYSGTYDTKEWGDSLIDEVKRAIKDLSVTNLQLWYEKKPILEKITIDVEVGDTIYMGRFKNKKTVIKKIDKDETGMPTINGKKVVTFRIQEPKKNPNFKGYKNRFKKKKVNESLDVGKEDIILLLGDSELVEIKSIKFYNEDNIDKVRYDLRQLDMRYNIYNLFEPSKGRFSYVDILNVPELRDITENDIAIINLDFFHPKMIRNPSFNYDGFIKQIIARLIQPIQTMNIECFVCMDRINYMTDPIASVYIILVNTE